MECNKEEAVRAKSMAEKKMENKDFFGARKFAIKAQNLYPELDNISQLIMVCDVHCSAANKVRGTEMDWYGILKLEPTADDVVIKKQFRKFALVLHPDKNKFAGATDAFKLIGEAQGVLLDRDKRRVHDIKCRPAAVNGAPRQPSRPSNVRRPPGPDNSSVNANKQSQQAPQTAKAEIYGSRPTFWTACPFCSVKFQYYREVLNKILPCQSCGKAFTGYEINARAPPQNNWSQQVFPKQTAANNPAPSKVGPHRTSGYSTAKVELGGDSGIGNTRPSDVAQGSKLNEKHGDVSLNSKQKRKAENSQTRVNMNGKKRKKLSESSESCNSETSSESEEEISVKIDGLYSELPPRRSSRSKRNVSYNENINEDNDTAEATEENKSRDSSQPTKEAVEDVLPKQDSPGINRSNGLNAHLDENHNDEEAKKAFAEEVLLKKSEDTGTKSEKEEPSEVAETEPEIYEYPDPDFSDFDKDREEKCFAAGQIWAIYDTEDAMPRFYAQIRKVFRPKFKLRITWLEPDPDDKDEIKWVEEDLPVSCGNYKQGSSENTEDHQMFSHLVSWEKGRRRDSYKIYPRKGETWALFKNWDINWSSDPDNSRKYEYEFVEVLSEYANGTAISVVYLYKIKGYVCLFCRAKQEGVDVFEIAPKELYRFSHRVPSFRMNGDERIDIPEGSFELDPACLPINLREIDPPATENIKFEKVHPPGSCSKFTTNSVKPNPKFHMDVSKSQEEHKNQSNPRVEISSDEEDQKLESDANGNAFDNPTEDTGGALDTPDEAYEIPDPEFYNFDSDKSIEKFEIGQVWALYSDEDGLPKYYGKINKIELLPKHKIHILWLGVGSRPDDMIQWTDKKMLFTCGNFKLKKSNSSQYTNTASFSHQVRVKENIKDEYIILPSKGEIWALYKNWNAGMKCSDLENCDYDMVEVVDGCSTDVTVLHMEVVDGFKSVFRAQVKGKSTVISKIPKSELLRFSHQIPAFRLTEEKGGSLRGYVELDPAALPFYWFCSN
ncbi:DnaJ subfamily B member like [Heracleum sosnowskyi]|uniref:DnaJ subfamily B member like n=1 Tax=Heracleum sosnowskyi TaxID=360622 RepID=A0AAD8N0M0_9APIA|nr:DnaJ subfamily B member like [Heracleum sosnowskyi]